MTVSRRGTARRKTIRRTKEVVQREILERLFPEGLDSVEIWEGFKGLFKKQGGRHLSIAKLTIVAGERLKLKKRIQQYFPRLSDQMYIIYYGDLKRQREITQVTWAFSETHEPHSKDIIILHGLTLEEVILDWAAQSVITMLLRYIKVTIEIPGQHQPQPNPTD